VDDSGSMFGYLLLYEGAPRSTSAFQKVRSEATQLCVLLTMSALLK
jgi:hypothetical protein